MTSYWEFSEIPRKEELSFNKVLENFQKFGVAGLIRENIQNSLDGKLIGIDKPVVVKIETGKVTRDSIPGIDEIESRINALEAGNNYTQETINHMKDNVGNLEIDYISFEDSNTKGLSGACNGQSDNSQDTWSAYAYSKGVHHVEKDSEVEKSRGGSHGIGKIASNAASDIYMMFFSNCDEYDNKHIGGTVQLIEHDYEGKSYRSTGYFTNIRDDKFYPYENTYDSIFTKNTRGLKIVIPFLREQFNDEKEIIKSICDSFFIAILNKKLEVVFNSKHINSETIKDYINSSEYYIQEIEENKTDFTPLYLNTYLNGDKFELIISDKNKRNYKFNLYFNYDKRIQKGRVGIIRTVGMKIEDMKVRGNINKPYNAILIPQNSDEDQYLKSLENESHTELSHEHIKDQNLKANAKRFINNISTKMKAIIEEYIRRNNPTDGLMDTDDVLYSVENKFKEELIKSTSSVKLSSGKNSKTVVKVKAPVKKDKKNKSEPDGEKKKGIRKVRPKEKSDEEASGDIFNVRSNLVRRAIINDRETLSIDLSSENEIKGIQNCNISFAVIDGMGKQHLDEFKIDENYSDIFDKNTKKKLSIEGNKIKNAPINDGRVNLDLYLNSSFNKTLKFIYYLEV